MSDLKQLRELIKNEIFSAERLDEGAWDTLKGLFKGTSTNKWVNISTLFDSERDFRRFSRLLQRVAMVVDDDTTIGDFIKNVRLMDAADLPGNFWADDMNSNDLENYYRRRRGGPRRRRSESKEIALKESSELTLESLTSRMIDYLKDVQTVQRNAPVPTTDDELKQMMTDLEASREALSRVVGELEKRKKEWADKIKTDKEASQLARSQ